VEIGAFRTYPADYKPPDEGPSEYQSIPLNKIEDFGVHCKQYYSLEVSYFKSSLDTKLLELLWNKYWINTLSSSPLLTNREYNARRILDLAAKVEQADQELAQHHNQHLGRGGGMFGAAAAAAPSSSSSSSTKGADSGPLAKVSADSARLSSEAAHGLMAQVLKHVVFNRRL
ncbi:hypothetical protein HK405_016073, partial [Cladochytrium tenue]